MPSSIRIKLRHFFPWLISLQSQQLLVPPLPLIPKTLMALFIQRLPGLSSWAATGSGSFFVSLLKTPLLEVPVPSHGLKFPSEQGWKIKGWGMIGDSLCPSDDSWAAGDRQRREMGAAGRGEGAGGPGRSFQQENPDHRLRGSHASTPLSHLPLPIAKETERSSGSGPLFWFGRPKAPFPGRVGCAFWGAFSYSEKEACYYSLVSGSFRRKK